MPGWRSYARNHRPEICLCPRRCVSPEYEGRKLGRTRAGRRCFVSARLPGQASRWSGRSARPEVIGQEVQAADDASKRDEAHRPELASLEPRDRGLIQADVEGELPLRQAQPDPPPQDRPADDQEPSLGQWVGLAGRDPSMHRRRMAVEPSPALTPRSSGAHPEPKCCHRSSDPFPVLRQRRRFAWGFVQVLRPGASPTQMLRMLATRIAKGDDEFCARRIARMNDAQRTPRRRRPTWRPRSSGWWRWRGAPRSGRSARPASRGTRRGGGGRPRRRRRGHPARRSSSAGARASAPRRGGP